MVLSLDFDEALVVMIFLLEANHLYEVALVERGRGFLKIKVIK